MEGIDNLRLFVMNKKLNKLLNSGKIPDGVSFLDCYNQIVRTDIAGTITTRVSVSCQTFISYKMEDKLHRKGDQPFRIRKLTPRECFRLMGLQDDEIDIIQSANISNSQMYHMAGNSIVVNVLDGIFENMFYPKKSKEIRLF